jgi:uncharacterized SAM-binding protein YcdF (DUF218 family)
MRGMPNSSLRRALRGFARGLLLTALSLLALVALVCGLIVIQGRTDESRRCDQRAACTAIVLGAAQWNGAPSPVLRARLDHALALHRSGRVSQIILTGGVGPGDTLSEAAAGKRYLVERNLPESALLLEEQGTTTWESLRLAADLARADGGGLVMVISDPFHMLRSLKMARDLGLEAYGSPTTTSPISENPAEEARYVLRESWAYLVYVFARQ